MDRKMVGILIILAGAIAIIGIVYVVFFYDFSKTGEEEQQQVIGGQEEILEEDQAVKLPVSLINGEKDEKPVISKTELAKANLKRMAAAFAERFGSYSNHSNYGNITDLKIFMSKEMQAWADNFINEVRSSENYSDIYYGITTKALSAEIKKFEEEIGEAEILVKTQRKEGAGTMSNASTFYQDIIIIFIKERGSWKVNNVHWQN